MSEDLSGLNLSGRRVLITGASRGNPAPQHILGYYEIKIIDDKELGLGKLRAEPAFDFEF